jgi:UDP-N-acetyl-D-mannosaminuronic acid dehydrogenase
MKLCVMGLGYIGLPTAVMFAKHGVQVHGVDVNPKVIETLINKSLHIEEPGLKESIMEVMDEGKLTVSTEPQEADAFIIAVPTPIKPDKTANVDYVRSATEMILPYLQKGNLVILESTVPPKTVDKIMLPILRKTGLILGEELFVSYSPERVLPGKVFEELVNNDRIVGGINEKSSKMTADLYLRFVKGTIHLTDTITAEMVKLMENTYRDVNIALANEFARIAEKIGFNVWEAINLANCHPRVNIHKPGPGVGGHCIAVDPWFIVEQAPVESKLISLSRNINDSTPFHVVDMIEKIVSDIKNPTITILGLTYKGNIDDMRDTPCKPIVNELVKRHYTIKIYDPYIREEFDNKVNTLDEAIEQTDCIVLLTDHNAFLEIQPEEIKEKVRNKIVYDTRNVLDKELWMKSGFEFITIGTKLVRKLHWANVI